MPQRHRKFGPSDGGVPPRSRRPFGRYFVPYIIEPYHIIIIKRNDNKFLSNLCFIQNQHRPLKFNHPLYIYIYIFIFVTRLVNLESPNFDVLWLKICLPTTTIILCFCYCSPNGTDFPLLFQYLTTSHETVTSSHPNAEVLYLGNFNVHHTEWLGSSHTNTGGKEAKSFSILNDLEQLIREPTLIPDRPNQFLNTLD